MLDYNSYRMIHTILYFSLHIKVNVLDKFKHKARSCYLQRKDFNKNQHKALSQDLRKDLQGMIIHIDFITLTHKCLVIKGIYPHKYLWNYLQNNPSGIYRHMYLCFDHTIVRWGIHSHINLNHCAQKFHLDIFKHRLVQFMMQKILQDIN